MLETQIDDEETQELIEARNDEKEKKDLRFNESNGMLMQENGMYVTNDMELKESNFGRSTLFSLCNASWRYKNVSYHSTILLLAR